MIEYQETDGVLRFKVRVVPRASRTEIAGEQGGALRVRLAASPVDGEANDELIRLISKSFRASRSSVVITAGQKSKMKTVAVSGGSVQVLLELFGKRN